MVRHCLSVVLAVLGLTVVSWIVTGKTTCPPRPDLHSGSVERLGAAALLGSWTGEWQGHAATDVFGYDQSLELRVVSIDGHRAEILYTAVGSRGLGEGGMQRALANLVDRDPPSLEWRDAEAAYRFVLDPRLGTLSGTRLGAQTSRCDLCQVDSAGVTRSRYPPLEVTGKVAQLVSLTSFGNFIQYVLIAGSSYLVLWLLLKKRLLHRRIQAGFPPAGQLWREIGYSGITCAVFGIIGLTWVGAYNAGWTKVYLGVEPYGWIYLAFTTGLLIVLHDAYFYWTHRLMHHPALFRSFHSVHHQATSPSPWSAYAFSPLEAAVQGLFTFSLVLVMPVSLWALVAWKLLSLARNAVGHSGFEVFPRTTLENRLLCWHTTVTHHDMHHQFADCHFGLYFTWWDRLAGTMHPDYARTFRAVTHRPVALETEGAAAA